MPLCEFSILTGCSYPTSKNRLVGFEEPVLGTSSFNETYTFNFDNDDEIINDIK